MSVQWDPDTTEIAMHAHLYFMNLPEVYWGIMATFICADDDMGWNPREYLQMTGEPNKALSNSAPLALGL